MKKAWLIVVVLCFLTTCGKTVDDVLVPTATINSIESTETGPSISPEARAYLDEALDVMQEHSINRHKIDWDSFRQEAHAQAHDAQTVADTYYAIRFALGELGDNHSGFMLPEQVMEFQQGPSPDQAPKPRGELLERGLGYVVLPGCSGAGEAAFAYATGLQRIIREIDVSNPCGWVVDLRKNGGGNMWPMLAGIGPVLGDGRAGIFIDSDGQQSFWDYTDGQARLDGQTLMYAGEIYRLQREGPPVAVLTGPDTRSSGEAIVVSFRGRTDTRSFGEGTGGLSTANQMYELSDGARLNLTVSVFADRTGYEYGDRIAPDQIVGDGQAGDDPALEMAVEWVLDQPGCTWSFGQAMALVGGYEGWVDYTNAEYGFSFRYPPDWTLAEVTDPAHTMKDHSVVLSAPDAVLEIGFKRASEDMPITRTGVGAGDFFTRGMVPFLGEQVARQVLVFKGKDMAVLYDSAGEVWRNDLVFTLGLDYVGDFADETVLREDVQAMADMVVASFQVSE